MPRPGPTASERWARHALGAVAGALLLACAGGPAGAPAATPPPAPAPSSAPATPAPDLTACPAQRRIACTREWRPVCAARADGSRETYGNACDACADDAVRGYRPGACEADAG